ncbi:MAG: hypothetical protein MUP39_04925 [Wolbachia endosymbiont of Homalodisca vitripennis]|nr:hypothetical protein [Wolbachia endosymbiont of Homalodisca vitripennis]
MRVVNSTRLCGIYYEVAYRVSKCSLSSKLDDISSYNVLAIANSIQ